MRPYQAEAVDRIADGLAGGGRGQLHAACGAGKTLISVLAGQRLLPANGLVVVLAPSLTLVAQTLTAWRTHGQTAALLAVCSDDTLADAPTRTTDLGVEVSTDPARIAAQLTAPGAGRRVVVGTYQSAGRLAQALRDSGLAADLAVLDEAHHLAGRPDFTTRRVLDDAYLPARRRLFMTATPRIYDARAETGALSMDDTAVYGPVLYHYSWARAISEGHLEDYRVVVMGTTESQAMKLLRDEDHHYTDRPGGPDLRMLAAQAVIAQTARRYGLRRILAFCPRLAAAREFAATMSGTVRRIPAHARPAGELYAGRIEGTMSDRQRQTELDRLRRPPGQWTVLANVRCLSEGVDVPAVDAVAFTHPKRSQVDIVQAVGRALRRSPGGTGTATIIVPIVIPDSAEEIGDLDPGEYATLWRVVRALRAHDDALGIELDAQRSHESTSSPQMPAKVTVELPPGTSERLLAALTVLTVRQTTSLWWTGYGHARAYYQQHGRLDVPVAHVTADGFRLGRWIHNARQHRRKGWLRTDRIDALDKIGMLWETRSRPWKTFLTELAAFREKFGHTLVPQDYVAPSGYRLGSKVNATRTRADQVPEHVRQALDDLGMVWDTRDLRWQQLYTACCRYWEAHGHLTVPVGHVTPDGYRLGAALKGRRHAWRRGSLDPAEQASLEGLGMVFGEDSAAWRALLAACDRYVAAHGSLAGIRKDYIDPSGYQLGARISYYRTLRNGTKGKGASALPAERKAALDKRGMVWRIAPARVIAPDETRALQALTGTDRARAILRLVDEHGVTQASIADVLGTHRSYLNAKLKQFRRTGQWADRLRRPAQ
ncbi:Helicase associated domain protein [Streptomyces xinghaiensis]|uniref:Uncharacterized protein n=1 Tax=Streptomyces fradiae TaxID=1906 RepID=A0ACC4WFR5_STRFR|nr:MULTISPECIES: DEAD/DEAH box helicase [Streptomyces]KNE83340.1 hypothetical protein ADZ36_05835 [Streptomyces fradiae]OFA37013.1 hypothetical protein BEN35_29260 [Streptomyces fradiae]